MEVSNLIDNITPADVPFAALELDTSLWFMAHFCEEGRSNVRLSLVGFGMIQGQGVAMLGITTRHIPDKLQRMINPLTIMPDNTSAEHDGPKYMLVCTKCKRVFAANWAAELPEWEEVEGDAE